MAPHAESPPFQETKQDMARSVVPEHAVNGPDGSRPSPGKRGTYWPLGDYEHDFVPLSSRYADQQEAWPEGKPINIPCQHPVANSPSLLHCTASDEVHDIISIGFGPAALAIAIALNDSLEFSQLPHAPRVCFLERQDHFAWHAGMQIPGATMQISWIKDLATIRNPRSRFTFLNYLHSKGRLLPFSNLGTFLPARKEYEDYMRWCAEAFDDVVSYDQEALEIVPDRANRTSSPVEIFTVKTRNTQTGQTTVRRARHVIVASGGKPKIPSNLPQDHSRVIHSSVYMQRIPDLFRDPQQQYRFAVLGGGQSSAETFNDMQSRFPNSQTRLIIRNAALKPSDDSPFVNEIFDPARTDGIYNAAPDVRAQDIRDAKETNYSVVRLTLLEQLYHKLYEQRLEYDNEEDWPHQILNFRDVKSINPASGKNAPLHLHVRDNSPIHNGSGTARDEVLEVDAVIVATGYERNLHDQLLTNAEALKPKTSSNGATTGWHVARDYRVKFKEGAVAPSAGVWLQGCCEDTHGLSDTLLSVLATRSGEVVESIFGQDMLASKLDGTHLNGIHEQTKPPNVGSDESERKVVQKSGMMKNGTHLNGGHVDGLVNGHM